MKGSEVPRRSRSLLVADGCAAVALTLFGAFAILDPPGPGFGGPVWVAWLVAGLAGLPAGVRRRWPVAVYGVVLASATVGTLLGVAGGGALWAVYASAALVLYLVASCLPYGRSAVALAVGLLASAAAIWVFYATRLAVVPEPAAEVPLWAPGEIGVTWVAMAALWTVGAVVRSRREAAARLARSLARTAVADERLRLARELHDIIGHGMSLIAVKATVANHLADTRPDQVRDALTVIEDTSRAALADIRRLLGVLRSDAPDLTPPPGPDRLPGLADTARSAGVEVDLQVRGADGLPEAVGLSVYRIVQEALTNVVKHAAPTRCQVAVTADGRVVHIDVVDDGRPHREPPKHPEGGHGLLGIRERVTMYGGIMSAGPRPEGGFHLTAHLPYEPSGATA
ncbi:sensor histidine kinase [Sphaerisporangium aureirubrum]|uniref:histidine kinase n=1 Tax=Sphaerisporangium aureirubrum TaxID=1544736 RepID=A0ABW1NCN8_9ACTN